MLAFSFWNAIWLVFVSFVFISVLMMMFSVIVDIFRDKSLSGWAKAAWLLSLALFTLLTLLVYVIVRGVLNPSLAPKLPREQTDVPLGQVLLQLAASFLPLAALIFCVLGAILFGFATPTEAAAVGASGSLILAAAYRALTWDRLREAVYLTARTAAMVCFLFVGSWSFSAVLAVAAPTPRPRWWRSTGGRRSSLRRWRCRPTT